MKKIVRPVPQNKHPPSFPIVGVGASAGGLEAFTALLKHFPADTGMSLVLVQHLDPTHESELTRLLARVTTMPTIEVTNNLRVEPNHIYVIPPNVNMVIAKGVLKLEPRPTGRTPPHAINYFFESLAQGQGEKAIGVVLSGTASDGTVGLEAIKAEGGVTFAQDETAKYDSMPRSAVAAGCVDFVLSPKNIARELARISRHPYVIGATADLTPGASRAKSSAGKVGRGTSARQGDTTALSADESGAPSIGARRSRTGAARRGHPDDGGFNQVLLQLRNHRGVDFSLYKSNTIQRRIARRVMLGKHDSIADYAKFLRGNVKELETLFSDVLISVTSFFRNVEAFDALKQTVFPQLLRDRSNDPLRVWVLGCSTGQEAYSIGMALAEAADNMDNAPKIQIFATDVNDALLEKARAGLYPKSIEADISTERLQRFFVEEDGGYRVVKPLRQAVVFARQNLVSDPPFSRMDLICCRNLLIYLEPPLQRKSLSTFHYALRPGGFLFLGASESVGEFADLFDALDKKQRIFSRKPGASVRYQPPASRLDSRGGGRGAAGSLPALPERLFTELSAQREADRLMVSEFAPPGVLINADLQIVQFRGPTSAFLAPPPGKASFDLLKMARPGMVPALRSAINKAQQDNKAVRKNNVRLDEDQDGNRRGVNIEVIPLKNLKERCYLILFREVPHFVEEPVAGQRVAETSPKSRRTAPSKTARGDEERTATVRLRKKVVESERELVETRDYLQAIQEQHDAASEELQASSEEAQSANEELQSINEELETSKEELESTNEELMTVNEEMANRNVELNRLTDELNNLHASIHTAILVVGRDLRIRRFTPLAEKLFNLLATDVGREFGGTRHILLAPPDEAPIGTGGSAAQPLDLETLVREVVDTVSVRQREVQDMNGCWYSLRIRPYMTLDNKIDGAVLALVDINALKNVERDLKDAEHRKDEFLATLAHELRGPLAPIRNALHILSQSDASPGSIAPTVGMLERQVAHMVHLVDDLLDVSRISQGKIVLRRERVELTSVLDHAAEAVRPHVVATNQELKISLPKQPIHLDADPTRLAQIVGNLLNNASKFTGTGGVIRLMIEREGEQVVIRVRDNGIGIAPDQLPRVFEMFVQLESSIHRAQGGLGLGLALAKKLVEMHAGTIEAHSRGLGQGAEFVVRLPVLTASADLVLEQGGSEGAAPVPRRILVVDDNQDSANSLAMVLRLSGHDVHTAYDGIDAVAAAGRLQPDVVLLDIGLPGLNGYDAGRRIREQQGDRKLLLVAVTGLGQSEDKNRSLAAGFDFHLIKPVEPSALVKMLGSPPADQGTSLRSPAGPSR